MTEYEKIQTICNHRRTSEQTERKTGIPFGDYDGCHYSCWAVGHRLPEYSKRETVGANGIARHHLPPPADAGHGGHGWTVMYHRFTAVRRP